VNGDTVAVARTDGRPGVQTGAGPGTSLPDWNCSPCHNTVTGRGRALRDCLPKPYPGRISLFRSSAVGPSSDTLGWHLFAARGVQEFVIHGRHLDILREPAVEELAKSFGPARMRQSASTRDRLA